LTSNLYSGHPEEASPKETSKEEQSWLRYLRPQAILPHVNFCGTPFLPWPIARVKPCVMCRKRSQHSPLLKTAGSRSKSWLTWAIFLTGRFSIAQGKQAWHDSEPLPWPQEAERFFRTLEAFEGYLASEAPLATSVEKLFQGPIADALTHTGQIAILRRLAGCPIRGENYYRAEIVAGRVGHQQTAPTREF
jgi:hypothetical protein